MITTSNALRVFASYCNIFRNVSCPNRRLSNGFTRKHIFGKYLFFTNTLMGGVLMGIGDRLQQRLEAYKNRLEKAKHNWTRTEHMVAVGCCLGFTQHLFYKMLDHYLPDTNLKTVSKKIAIDLAILSPIAILVFLCGLGLLEKRRLEEIQKEVREKFLHILVIDCIIWPPIQYVNFAFLPNKLRVIYVNSIMVVYDMILSHIKYEYSP